VDPIPNIPETATSDDVKRALEGTADPRLAEKITTPEEYLAYREWAMNRADLTPQQIKEAPQSWYSYALDAENLLARAPTDEELHFESFEIENGKMDLSFYIEGVSVGKNAKASNLAKVFAVEGVETLDSGDFSGDKVDVSFGISSEGRVNVNVQPKNNTANSFFVRLKVLP
jgi:hypothetical protein